MKLIKSFLLINLAILALTFSSTVKASDDGITGEECKDSTDLVALAYFDYFVDTIGSYVDTTTPIYTEDKMINLVYNVTKVLDTTNWPYLEFDFFLPEDAPWKNLCALKVTYRADHPLRIALNQPVLLDFGQSYQRLLPASTHWSTTTVYLKEFKQPDWSTHKDVALDMKNIQALSFTPETDPLKSTKKGSFKLKEVVAYGISVEAKDTINTSIIFYSISDEMIFLRVKEGGKYSFDVLNTNGTPILSIKDQVLEDGYNKVKLPETIKNGIYYIKISNSKESVKKLGVVGNIPTYYRR